MCQHSTKTCPGRVLSMALSIKAILPLGLLRSANRLRFSRDRKLRKPEALLKRVGRNAGGFFVGMGFVPVRGSGNERNLEWQLTHEQFWFWGPELVCLLVFHPDRVCWTSLSNKPLRLARFSGKICCAAESPKMSYRNSRKPFNTQTQSPLTHFLNIAKSG